MSEEKAQMEDRIILETGVAGKIARIAEPVIEDIGFRLVQVRLTGERGCTVQITAERPDGFLNIDDCAAISRALSPVLDVEDPVSGKYVLAVSSPGIDRVLVRPGDFEKWTGQKAKMEMKSMIDGRKRFKGVLEGFEDDEVRLIYELHEGEEPVTIGLPIKDIALARLVMSDELLKQQGS